MASLALATGYNCYKNYRKHRSGSSVPCNVLSQHHNNNNESIQQKPNNQLPRRDIILRSSELAVIGAILNLSGEKPDYLGVQKNNPALASCRAIKDCVSTSANVADLDHYAAPWNYNGGRSRKSPVSREVAMKELLEAVKERLPQLGIVEQKDDYVRLESKRPLTGSVDDVEFWFPPGNNSIVQYRVASREDLDSDINRKRIEALGLELEKKGWAS